MMDSGSHTVHDAQEGDDVEVDARDQFPLRGMWWTLYWEVIVEATDIRWRACIITVAVWIRRIT